MPKPKHPYHRHKDPLDHKRNRWFVRSRAQAEFRGEQWNLTYEEFCEFWPTEEIINRRGRDGDSLCLTRLDPELPWDRTNTCQVTRKIQLTIKNRRQYGLEVEHLFKEAKWL